MTIKIKSSNGQITNHDITYIETITLQKGDYIYISESRKFLKLELMENSLEIEFPNKEKVVLDSVLTLFDENGGEIVNGLMDKLDTTSIAFLDENSNFVEISSLDELLNFIEKTDDKPKINYEDNNQDNKGAEKVELDNNFADIIWDKSNESIKDGDNSFDVWVNEDLTVYLDTSITAKDI
jgi:hypothetical protein